MAFLVGASMCLHLVILRIASPSKFACLDHGGVEKIDEPALRAADWLEEPAVPFILLSSRVSSSEICFLGLKSLSKFLKYRTHKTRYTDTVQCRNLWHVKSLNTGTACLEAGLARFQRLLLLSKEGHKLCTESPQPPYSTRSELSSLAASRPVSKGPLILYFVVITKACWVCPDVFFPLSPAFLHVWEEYGWLD